MRANRIGSWPFHELEITKCREIHAYILKGFRSLIDDEDIYKQIVSEGRNMRLGTYQAGYRTGALRHKLRHTLGRRILLRVMRQRLRYDILQGPTGELYYTTKVR